MSFWQTTTWAERGGVPRLAGVYVVFASDGRVIYIGQSEKLGLRLARHDLRLPGEARVKYRIDTKLGEWLKREYRLIYRLRPELNRTPAPTIGQFARSMAGRVRKVKPPNTKKVKKAWNREWREGVVTMPNHQQARAIKAYKEWLEQGKPGKFAEWVKGKV